MYPAASLIEFPWFIAAATTAMLIAWHRWDELPRWAQHLWLASSVAIIAAFGVRATEVFAQRFSDRAVWDFYAFWVHGRVAWLGLDFYDNDAIRSVMPFPPRPGWAAELLVEGSPYPPFTSFLFAPFGAFSYPTAYWLWGSFNAAAAVAACVLAGRWLFRDHPHGWAVAALTFVLLRASLYTVYVQQSSFLILLLGVLLLRHADRAISGAWIALAVVVKPMAAVFIVHPLASMRWRALLAGAGVGLAFIAGSALIWGPERWGHYIEHPPSEWMPASVPAEPVNQSIGARMSRHFGWHERGERMTAEPLFIAVVASMVLATAAVIGWRRRERDAGDADASGGSGPLDVDLFGLSAGVALALVIYPASKQHYGVLLAVPAWALWSARARLPRFFPPEAAALFIAATWVLVSFGRGGRSWIAFIAWWALMLALTALSSRRSSSSDSSNSSSSAGSAASSGLARAAASE